MCSAFVCRSEIVHVGGWCVCAPLCVCDIVYFIEKYYKQNKVNDFITLQGSPRGSREGAADIRDVAIQQLPVVQLRGLPSMLCTTCTSVYKGGIWLLCYNGVYCTPTSYMSYSAQLG